jgi:hypothetical protein
MFNLPGLVLEESAAEPIIYGLLELKMASTFAVTRNHLIFGLCLPLAVLMGYVLAEPFESTSMTVLLMVVAVLVVPMLMRWYHPLLVVSWYLAAVTPVPGTPYLWSTMSFLALLFAILNRSVNPEHRLHQETSLTRPMVVLAVVVVGTIMTTGGIGLRILGGGESVGGRGYFYILAAIAGYFALSSRLIPMGRAGVYVTLFFLSGLSELVGMVATHLGPTTAAYFAIIFPAAMQPDGFDPAGTIDPALIRIGGWVGVSQAVIFWLLARYGIEGVFTFSRPWRLATFVAVFGAGMYGGFRSSVLLVAGVFAILFCIEKLWRTKVMITLMVAGVLGGAVLAGFADRLPFAVQRALSMLPLSLDYEVQQSAEHSSQWRIEMWKATLPQVPQYLFKGKGYNLSADDLFMAQMSQSRGLGSRWEASAYAGDYHNGPLSVVIPFGIYGVIAFGWLLTAGARFLYMVYRDGAEELRRINALLLALFLARVLMFLFVFGSLYVELFHFTGILGLSVALNANRRSQAGNEVAGDEAAHAGT